MKGKETMKRTYQPNKRKRAKCHGFRARMATKGKLNATKRQAPTIIEKFPANFSTLQPNIVQLFAVQSILVVCMDTAIRR